MFPPPPPLPPPPPPLHHHHHQCSDSASAFVILVFILLFLFLLLPGSFSICFFHFIFTVLLYDCLLIIFLFFSVSYLIMLLMLHFLLPSAVHPPLHGPSPYSSLCSLWFVSPFLYIFYTNKLSSSSSCHLDTSQQYKPFFSLSTA